MKLLSTSLLVFILAFAAACSQGNYAQVEPDDLYFTHKDRKAANVQYMASATADNAYDYNDRDVSNYTNQHSPTIYSSTLGSPTIQSTTETFYDANQNPDYVSVQADPTAETSNEYYVEEYGLPIIETETIVPQTVINYNIYGANPYSNISPWSSSFSFSFGYAYGSFYDPFNPYYNPYYSNWGYNPYRSSYYDNNRPWNNSYYGGGYSNYGSGSYCYYPVKYSNSNYGNSYYGNSNYNSSNTYSSDNGAYKDGTKIKTGPRRSRSTVSDYTNGQYTSRKRTSYTSDGNSGGRISGDTNNGRQVGKAVPASKERNPYRNNGTDKDRKARYGDMNSSSPTIQKNNTRRKVNTTVQRQWSRGNSGVSSPNNRTNTNKNYSGPSRRGQSSGYTRSRSNSSYTPSRSKSSGGSSYSPSRSSSGQRSAPSRSSGTKSTSTTTRKRN